MNGRAPSSAGRATLTCWDRLGEAEWLRLAPAAHPYESRAWLLATMLETHAALMVEDRDGALGALSLVPTGAIQAPLHHPRDVFAGTRGMDLFAAAGGRSRHHARAATADWSGLCSALSPYAYRAACRAHGASPAALRELLETALDACAAVGAHGLALPYLREPEDAPLLEAALAIGGRATVLGAGCRLPVRWSSLAGYFAWLGASRSTVRRRFARPAPGVRRARLLAAGEALAEEVRGPAVSALAAVAASRGDAAPPRSLYEAVLSYWPGERLVVWTEGPAENLRACGVTFLHDGVVSCKWFADPAASGEYLHLAYPFLLEHAIEAGLRAVDWGAGSHEAKLLRGGELYWITGALISRDAAFTAAVAGWLEEYTRAVTRHLSDLSARCGRHHERPAPPGWV